MVKRLRKDRYDWLTEKCVNGEDEIFAYIQAIGKSDAVLCDIIAAYEFVPDSGMELLGSDIGDYPFR